MTKERYMALKDWLVKTALKFYSLNGIFKDAAEKEEWYNLYQKENAKLEKVKDTISNIEKLVNKKENK